jgi:hypothetical protein
MIRKSPFDGLVAHAKKARECIHKLKKAVECYVNKKYEEFDNLAQEILKIENEADWIKGNIRNHLPRSIFMPVDKREFLGCLAEQDKILDLAQDIVIWLGFHKTEIPKEIKELFLKHLYGVVDTVETLEDMVENVKKLIVPLTKKERQEAKDTLKSIHIKERESDEREHELAKKFFSLKDFPIAYHLLHTTFMIAHIADHAENASDRIRSMLAR